MIELLRFMFSSFWHFAGCLIILGMISHMFVVFVKCTALAIITMGKPPEIKAHAVNGITGKGGVDND